MKKVLFRDFGGVDVLEIAETPIPKIENDNQLLIKISHAGLNPIDYKIRNGSSFVAEKLKNNLPSGLGFEIAGTVVEAKDNNLLYKKVCGFVGFPLAPSAYAEYALADVNNITLIPENVSDAIASVLPLAGLTALQSLQLFGTDLQDMKLLIHAGAGGVGHLAIQLAKHKGAYVITSASKKNHEYLVSIGADNCLDYREDNYLQQCGKIDGVLDLVGGQTGLDSVDILDKNTLLVTVPTMTKDSILEKAKPKGLKATGMLMRVDMPQLHELLSLVQTKKLSPHIAHMYPMTKVKEAHQQLETGGFIGKLCLEMLS